MSQYTDHELIGRSLSGDQSAFAELVRRHERRVSVTVKSVIGDLPREDMADICQDIFVLIFKSLGSFRGDSKFSTYITRIALRHCYREAKRRRKRKFLFFSYDAASDDGDAESMVNRVMAQGSTDRDMIAGERKSAVVSAMARLPEEFRTVLVLRVVEEMSVEEVAETLGISTGTVKSRLYRAKEKMRELLTGIEDLEYELEL